MHPYVVEDFTDAEAAVLRRYFTNLEGPVFALVNLPEVVKGALFARYSRSSKSLRRLFLDEFVGDLELDGDAHIDATVGLERADELYQRIFYEYGDDSVAQLGGVHLACEQASNLLTKVLERGRLMSYLEQSTRYLGYDRRLPNGLYRFYRDSDILDSRFGARYIGEMDRMFDTYRELLPELTDWLTLRFPKTAEDTDFVYRQAIRAKALDGLRGLLPASALSNLGIYASGQAYESLLFACARTLCPRCASTPMMLAELVKVIPSFLRRLDVPERGTGVDVSTLPTLARPRSRWSRTTRTSREADEGVRLVAFDPEGESRVLEAIVFANSNVSHDAATRRVAAMSSDERRGSACDLRWPAQATDDTARGAPLNERTTASRWSVTTVRFATSSAIVSSRSNGNRSRWTSDLTCPRLWKKPGWPNATESRSVDPPTCFYDVRKDFPEQAQYCVALAFRIRYVMQMNAREAMHLIELRSGPQGHPSYRRVAQEMARLIREEAGHEAIADAMTFVDFSDTDLERLEAERAAERNR